MGKRGKMKENQQLVHSKLIKRSISSHNMQPNYGALILKAMDVKSSCPLATSELCWELKFYPSVQECNTSSQSLWTFLSIWTVLREKRSWTYSLLVSHFQHGVTCGRQHRTDSYHHHRLAHLLIDLLQCLACKMPPISFDGNSATQVKSLLLFSSFVLQPPLNLLALYVLVQQ